MSIMILVFVVLGGIGNIRGSMIAAVILTLLPEMLRSLNNYRMLIYAVILIIVMLFKPSGLMGQHEFSLSGIVARLKAGKVRPAKKGKGE